MSPPERRTNDATQLSVPILIVIAMVVSGVSGAFSASAVYWTLRLSNQEADFQLKSDINSIKLLMESDKIIKGKDAEILNQRFAALEAKIESAGLRNAALAMTRELQQNGEKP